MTFLSINPRSAPPAPFFGLRVDVSTADQRIAAGRFSLAVMRPRVEPVTAFALESHMPSHGSSFTRGLYKIWLQ
ncbi:hypothetical protein BSFA1_75940 (plasmid) [Burkholderia sp. SFA1]|nr:hypothetical protein BSFA1_75940 [Burkholderia sp. SFA1]